MRPVKFDQKAHEYHERVARLAAQRRLVVTRKRGATSQQVFIICLLIFVSVATYGAAIFGG